MTDGMIGNSHVTVPDLMERVIAFRTLTYKPPLELRVGEPNEFKLDLTTGRIIRNEELIESKKKEAFERHGPYKVDKYKKPIGQLKSPQFHRMAVNDEWKKEMKAKCGNEKKHKAPASDCTCGLYCYYEFDVSSRSGYSYSSHEVHCCVSVEGHIEAHSTGMRCEKMRIEAIYALSYTNLKETLEHLDIMFIPTEQYSSEQFLMMCKEFGDPLPKELRA